MGLLLKVLAAVVYLQFVATQVYDPLLAGVGLEIWRILDPLMVLGLAVALVNSYHRKRQVVSVADDGVTREYLGNTWKQTAFSTWVLRSWPVCYGTG